MWVLIGAICITKYEIYLMCDCMRGGRYGCQRWAMIILFPRSWLVGHSLSLVRCYMYEEANSCITSEVLEDLYIVASVTLTYFPKSWLVAKMKQISVVWQKC